MDAKSFYVTEKRKQGNFRSSSRSYLDNRQIGFMNLTCFRIGRHAPELIPARAERAWMDGELR
jgi:hypothetical protein